MAHIKRGLGISGIATEASAWRYVPQQEDTCRGAQIDLVIKRVDKIVHLCEMKFAEHPYAITKDYEERLKTRRLLFMEVTGESRGAVLTMVTPNGLKSNAHSALIHSVITIKDLYADV